MLVEKSVDQIIGNIRAHAHEYEAPLGDALHDLAQRICTENDISPTVRKLFGPENALYTCNEGRETDIAELFKEIGLPRSW
jgi:hypothetical protein